MKSKSFFAAIAVAFLLFSACRNAPEVSKVKTEYHITRLFHDGQEYGGPGTTDSFVRGEDGYQRRFHPNERYVEETKGNVTESKILDQSGKVIASSVTFLNDKGLVDSIIYKDDVMGTYIHKYVYDDEGRLIEDRNYPSSSGPNHVWKFRFDNGNIVEEQMIHHPAFDTSEMLNPKTGKMEEVITTYEDFIAHNEYHTDKPNQPTRENFGYKTDNSPERASKNLRKRMVQVSLKGDTTDIYDYHYHYDDKGRVIAKVQTSRSGGSYDSTAYTYY
jgi:hypothetical protein